MSCGPGSVSRVMVFSERIDTLLWLRDQLRARLQLPADALPNPC
jgi:hypothetical protein